MSATRDRYAASTEVTPERSRTEIERSLRRFGATSFAYAWVDDTATIAFHIGGLTVRISVRYPVLTTTSSASRRRGAGAPSARLRVSTRPSAAGGGGP